MDRLKAMSILVQVVDSQQQLLQILALAQAVQHRRCTAVAQGAHAHVHVLKEPCLLQVLPKRFPARGTNSVVLAEAEASKPRPRNSTCKHLGPMRRCLDAGEAERGDAGARVQDAGHGTDTGIPERVHADIKRLNHIARGKVRRQKGCAPACDAVVVQVEVGDLDSRL